MTCKHGRHNMKNSQGDSGGDIDKIFCLILYDFKDFDNFSEKVRGMHPPHPPPCDVLDCKQMHVHDYKSYNWLRCMKLFAELRQ